MGRHPLKTIINEFLDHKQKTGEWSADTVKERERKLRYLMGELKNLKSQAKIAYDNPKKITKGDVLAIDEWLQTKDIVLQTKRKYRRLIKELMEFKENYNYTHLINSGQVPSMDDETTEEIIKCTNCEKSLNDIVPVSANGLPGIFCSQDCISEYLDKQEDDEKIEEEPDVENKEPTKQILGDIKLQVQIDGKNFTIDKDGNVARSGSMTIHYTDLGTLIRFATEFKDWAEDMIDDFNGE